MTISEILPANLEALRVKIGEFLNIMIYRSDFIFLNLWSIVHLFSGFLIMLILSIFQKGWKRITTLFALLLAWEGFEYVFYGILKSPNWIPEPLIDVIWDLILGMLGGLIAIVLVSIIKGKNIVVQQN